MLNAWRMAHIAAGSVALATFWIPLVTFKGGRIHRGAGLVYAWSMLVVVVAAVGAAGWRLLYDMDAAARSRSVFLSFIALLTFAAGWNGLRALRTKRRAGPALTRSTCSPRPPSRSAERRWPSGASRAAFACCR